MMNKRILEIWDTIKERQPARKALGSAGSRQLAKIRERLKDNPFQMDIEKLYSEKYEKDYALIKRIWIINEEGKIEDLTGGIE